MLSCTSIAQIEIWWVAGGQRQHGHLSNSERPWSTGAPDQVYNRSLQSVVAEPLIIPIIHP